MMPSGGPWTLALRALFLFFYTETKSDFIFGMYSKRFFLSFSPNTFDLQMTQAIAKETFPFFSSSLKEDQSVGKGSLYN